VQLQPQAVWPPQLQQQEPQLQQQKALVKNKENFTGQIKKNSKRNHLTITNSSYCVQISIKEFQSGKS
jgi:hypothetical protein